MLRVSSAFPKLQKCTRGYTFSFVKGDDTGQLPTSNTGRTPLVRPNRILRNSMGHAIIRGSRACQEPVLHGMELLQLNIFNSVVSGELSQAVPGRRHPIKGGCHKLYDRWIQNRSFACFGVAGLAGEPLPGAVS
jgi:hypothetical protein